MNSPLYLKTTWTYEERPVRSSKLNTWDDRIEASLEVLAFLLATSWGGGNGVLRGATTNDLKVTPKTPPAMTVQVNPGYAFINKLPYKLATLTDTPELTAPNTHPRIDLIQANLETWSITHKPGTEATTPTAPTPDTNCLPLAQIYLRPTATSIKSTDDTTNAYIIDTRPFL